MAIITDYLVPLLLLVLCCLALRKKENPYGILMNGAADGFHLLISLLPTMILLLTAVHMLRASGAVELICKIATPLFARVGIPPETAILVLIRPISGSAALAVGTELMATYGPDSLIGRTTAIMLGSTETTFYTISVYLGATGIHKTRYTIPAALIADITGFLMAALTARIL